MATNLKFLCIGWTGPAGAPREHFIRLATPKGQIRDVPLTVVELACLAKEAVASLAGETVSP